MFPIWYKTIRVLIIMELFISMTGLFGKIHPIIHFVDAMSGREAIIGFFGWLEIHNYNPPHYWNYQFANFGKQ
jgi:hypothetical protein